MSVRTIGLLGAMIALLATICLPAAAEADAAAPGYAIVVSRATQADPGWKQIVDALKGKHGGAVIAFDKSVDESLDVLRTEFPRYVAFVATPEEATREFVARVHRLARRLDDDPYADVLWGIVTGYDAENALRIARHNEPLVVRRVAAGTEVELQMCEEGVWYCELVKNRMVRKERGKEPAELKAPDDTTKALVDSLNVWKAQLFVTSGHATERDWQIGYRYRNGQFRSKAGQLFGVDTQGNRYPIDSPNPKVYLPAGNCLMGHIDGPDAMALAWLNSAGVYQMIGYTLPTWYGYAGWGCLDYFVEQPGRFTFAEAFFANHQALVHRLHTYFPQAAHADLDSDSTRRAAVEVSETARAAGLSANDARGLLFDRDVVAFYGDPAWEARMAPGPLAWQQKLTQKDGVYTFQIIPKRGQETFKPINTNGSQRGGRPIVHWLPHRVKDVQILEGADLQPLVADDFILVPNPRRCDPERSYRVVFRARPAHKKASNRHDTEPADPSERRPRPQPTAPPHSADVDRRPAVLSENRVPWVELLAFINACLTVDAQKTSAEERESTLRLEQIDSLFMRDSGKWFDGLAKEAVQAMSAEDRAARPSGPAFLVKLTLSSAATAGQGAKRSVPPPVADLVKRLQNPNDTLPDRIPRPPNISHATITKLTEPKENRVQCSVELLFRPQRTD